MTKVLTPLTTPAIKTPPEDTSPPPQSRTRETAFSVRAFQSNSRPAARVSSWGSQDSTASSRSCIRWMAAGSWLVMERTAPPIPGLMTQAARATTPVIAARVRTRARGRRRGFHRRPRGRQASMARMGTFKTKAMAPPTRKGARTPSTQRRAPARLGRFCRAQKKATPPQATSRRCFI